MSETAIGIGATAYMDHSVDYKDYREQINKVVEGAGGNARIRFRDGKVTTKGSLNPRQLVAMERHFAKSLWRSIENQVGSEEADRLMPFVRKSGGDFKLFASLTKNQWERIDNIVMNSPRLIARSRNTTASLDHGVQRTSYNDAQVTDFQEVINDAVRRDLKGDRRIQKTGDNRGLHKDFITDFGRDTYKIDGAMLASPTLGKSPEQVKNAKKTINSKITNNEIIKDMKVISSVLHQGIFGIRNEVAEKHPENSHPLPFVFAPGTRSNQNEQTDYGSFYNLRPTGEHGKYHFTAINKVPLSAITMEKTNEENEITQVYDRCDENSSYMSIAYAGTIDVNNHDNPVELIDVRVEYEANRFSENSPVSIPV